MHEETKGPVSGIRARSTVIRTNNGRVFSIVNIGVPEDHPLADRNSMAGPSGLHNINIGGISMPAPSFVILHRGNSENPRTSNNPTGPSIQDDEARGD